MNSTKQNSEQQEAKQVHDRIAPVVDDFKISTLLRGLLAPGIGFPKICGL